MKIFICWSDEHSRAIAKVLNDWLPRVIQAVKPFYSPDIEKGAKWSNEIDNALEGTKFGIICLTPNNLNSTWIHFETGALSKTKDASIWTFLIGLKPSDVEQPLGKFQHTVFGKDDVFKLVKAINSKVEEPYGNPLPEDLLKETFDDYWGKLETKLKEIEKVQIPASPKVKEPAAEIGRSSEDMLDEILELLRSQQRNSPLPIPKYDSFIRNVLSNRVAVRRQDELIH